MATVELRNVVKAFDDVEVVKGLSLHVQDGEFAVLVGPSGCGKTTTLRMIAGLESITRGELVLGGRVVNEVPPRDRDIAMVFQNYALYPHMTVYENMAFGLRLRRVPQADIDRRVREAAALLDIGELLDRRPRALSGGQRQRVAMGRAIVRNPAVFLFDEPLSNLDAQLRVQMRVELSRLHRRLATTTIYVTHDQVEAMTLADRIAILDAGRLQQFGTPLEVYRAPANRFVAGFIGSPPMNFLAVSVEATGAALQLRAPGVRIDLDEAERRVLREAGGDKAWVLGIRPEHLHVGAPDGQACGHVEAEVEVVEHLGADDLVYARTPGDVLVVARVAGGSAPSRGQHVTLAVEPGAVHVFDGEGHNAFAALRKAGVS